MNSHYFQIHYIYVLKFDIFIYNLNFLLHLYLFKLGFISIAMQNLNPK